MGLKVPSSIQMRADRVNEQKLTVNGSSRPN